MVRMVTKVVLLSKYELVYPLITFANAEILLECAFAESVVNGPPRRENISNNNNNNVFVDRSIP